MSEKENILKKIRLLIRETIEHSLTKYMEPKDFFSSKDATGLLTYDFIKQMQKRTDFDNIGLLTPEQTETKYFLYYNKSEKKLIMDSGGEKFTYAEDKFINSWAKCMVKGGRKGYITLFKDSENVSGYQILFIEVEDTLWSNFNKFLINLSTVKKIPYYQLF